MTLQSDPKKIQACAAAIVSLQQTKREITDQYQRDMADLDRAIANFITNFITNFKTLAAS